MKLTRKAAEVLQGGAPDSYRHVGEEAILRMATEALERPSDAGFWDESLYVTHTLMFHTPDWSLTNDYIAGEANYRTALAELTATYPHDVEDASVGHWTYSRYSCIKVRVLTEGGNVTPAFVAASLMAIYIRDEYPILDDSLFSELECEVWDAGVDDAIDTYNRFNRDDAEALTERESSYVREFLGENYGPGYSDPGWIDEAWMTEAVEYARAMATPSDLPVEIQEHQETSLF